MSKKDVKRLARDGIVYFVLALGCVIGSGYVPHIWHDALLLIGGVLLGLAAAIMVILDTITQKDKANADG